MTFEFQCLKEYFFYMKPQFSFLTRMLTSFLLAKFWKVKQNHVHQKTWSPVVVVDDKKEFLKRIKNMIIRSYTYFVDMKKSLKVSSIGDPLSLDFSVCQSKCISSEYIRISVRMFFGNVRCYIRWLALVLKGLCSAKFYFKISSQNILPFLPHSKPIQIATKFSLMIIDFL